MPYKERLNSILDDAKSYLKQQEELYGDLSMLLSKKKNHVSDFSKTPKVNNKNQIQPELDLFGNVLKEEKNEIKKSKIADKQNYPNEPWVNAQSIQELNTLINKCTKCALGYTRKNFVFGVGDPKAGVVVVGEAPGADEDEQGEPFVGRAGQLLNKILQAVQFKREEVFICNVLKCRPPNNRDPQSEEIESCEPYLWKQLELIKPKIILCAGRIAGQALLKTNASLVELRSKVHDYRGIPLVVTYHPAALLRNPNWKRPCWEDMQAFRKLYDEMKK